MRNFENIVSKEVGLASGEITPKNRLQNQIRLATQIFSRVNGFVDLNKKEDRHKVESFWVDDGFAEIYSNLEKDEEFKFHRRLNGDILSITPDDIIFYKNNDRLPED